MDDLVDTVRGPMPRKELEFRDVTHETESAVQTTRIWTYRGVEVRRDGWVDLKCGHSTAALKGM